MKCANCSCNLYPRTLYKLNNPSRRTRQKSRLSNSHCPYALGMESVHVFLRTDGLNNLVFADMANGAFNAPGKRHRDNYAFQD